MKKIKEKDRKVMRKREANKLMLIGISLILLIGFIFIVSALTSEDKTALQSELDNLTQSLNDNGYSWLVDYNLKNGGIL